MLFLYFPDLIFNLSSANSNMPALIYSATAGTCVSFTGVCGQPPTTAGTCVSFTGVCGQPPTTAMTCVSCTGVYWADLFLTSVE